MSYSPEVAMPDPNETVPEPTEQERETVFSPHQSPRRQADGDPGRKPEPGSERDDVRETEIEPADPAESDQADGVAR